MRTDEKLLALGVPSHLVYRCKFLGSLGGGRPVINIESTTDVSIPDLMTVFALGLGILIVPAADFDLTEIEEALSWAPAIRLAYPMHGSYFGIEVLEGAVHLEDLYIAGDQSEWADISRLPRLERVNCQGAQALSGASNPHVRRLRVEVDRIPAGFTSSAAIEELWVSAGKSLRDLSCFTDLSQLTVLQVQRAARLDIGGLSEATNLKSLDLVLCREVVGFDSVVDLPHLRSIQVFSVHSIPDFDSLTRFGGGRLFVEGNYVFDEEFQSRFRDRKGWHFSPYKPKRSPGVSASTHATFVEGVDVSTFAPFEISEGDDGSFQLTYEDWTGFEEILGDAPGAESSDTADLIAEAELRRAAPELLTTPGFTFDSEGGLMMIRTESLGDIERVARVLLGVWGNTRRMRTLARKAISSPRGVTSAE